MSIERWANHLLSKGLGVLSILFGSIILSQIPSFYESEVDFKSNAHSATGTVIKSGTKTYPIPNGTSTTFRQEVISTVRFHTHQGKLVDFTTTKACSSLRDCHHQKVSVLYDSRLPSKTRVDSGLKPEAQAQGFLMLSSIFLLGGTILLMNNWDGTSSNKLTMKKP